MKYWITTDTHFGHQKLLEFGRPIGFEQKIMRHLEAVHADDVLIHLGDFCVGNEAYWHDMFKHTVPGKHWLIRGNHDKKSNSWYLTHGWDFVANSFNDTLFGAAVCFSHKPVVDSGYTLNLHGHFHNSQVHQQEPELKAIQNPKQHLLALEYNNYQPWNLRTLIEKYASKKP